MTGFEPVVLCICSALLWTPQPHMHIVLQEGFEPSHYYYFALISKTKMSTSSNIGAKFMKVLPVRLELTCYYYFAHDS